MAQEQKPPDLDDNLNPVDEQPPDLDDTGAPTISEPSFLSKAWSAISEPLTDLPSRFASSVAESIDPKQGEAWTIPESIPFIGGMAPRGFVAGATQGIGDIASSMTSPINLGTAALTGGASLAGKSGLNTLAQGLKTGARLTSAPVIAHGASTVLDPNTDMGEKGFGIAEIAGGIAGIKGPKSRAKVASVVDEVKPPVTPQYQWKVGQTVVIKSNKATPEIVKKARSQGFEFEGLNDQGDFRFKKTREVGPEQPVLESEIGNIRGTLGPKTDIKKSSPFVEAFNFPRAVMASIDFSAPLRQGLPLIHKKQFWTSLDDMFKAWGSENAFRAIQDDIASRPLFRQRVGPNNKLINSFADEVGLKLTDLTDLTKREEAIMSTWAEKVPGVRRSNRAYTAFLNKLRADTFEDLINKGSIFGADGKTNVPLARALADFVNTASGRGSLGKLEQSAVALNTLLFSPRLIASRLKMLNPAYYIMAKPMVRREALKSLFAVAAAGNTVGQLGKMAGGTIESDPNSSDYGKIHIGNTRIDPYAGFQQYIVAANRLLRPGFAQVPGLEGGTDTGIVPLDMATGTLGAGGQKLRSSESGQEYDLWNPEGPFDPTHLSVLGRFGRSKLHPVLGFAASFFSGRKEMTGEPMDFSTMNPMENAIAQRFMPILFQDIYELAKDDPTLIPMAVLPAMGMGIQTYGEEQ